MAITAPSEALVSNRPAEEGKPTYLDALCAAVRENVRALLGARKQREAAGREVVTFDETRQEAVVTAVPARADATTRIVAGLQWIREQDQARYAKVEDAVITLAAARPGFQPENYAGCEGVVRLAQEVGADLEAFFATPPVAHPVRATVAETRRAYEEIFGAADRAFRGHREARAVRVSRWEAMMDAAERGAAASFSPALEAKERKTALAA